MLGTEHLRLAEAAFAQQSLGEAVSQARQALAAGLDTTAPDSERGEYVERPETAQCESLLGVALHEQGDSEAALEHLDRAVLLDRGRARPWANRGHVRRVRGELELALADLDRALQLQPSYAFARFRRAQCYVDLARLSESEQDLAALLSVDPYDAAPLALWQSLRAQRGAPADVSELPAPQDALALFSRANLHGRHGEWQRALADYDVAYTLQPAVWLLAYRGLAHVQLGDLPRALQDLEAYAASDPNNAAVNAALLEVRARLDP